MTASKVKGYYHATGTTKILALESHPITYQQIQQDVWTHRPTNLALDMENTRLVLILAGPFFYVLLHLKTLLVPDYFYLKY
jgi:hypothetical protein